MQAFIFTNTSASIAWLSAKALASYAAKGNNFVAVFDHEYDILENVPELYQKIYFLNTPNIFKTIKECDLTILDFDLDMFANNCATYQEYINLKISKTSKPLSLHIDVNNQLDNVIADFNKHQFTDVFLSIKDQKYFSFCKEYLEDLVNVITYNTQTIVDLYYLINKCSFVVTDNQIEYLIAKDLNIPSFVIVDNLNVAVEKSKNTFIFDPFKNEPHPLPPSVFCKDRELTKKVNSQIINQNSVKDLLLTELKDALDKYKVPYVTCLPN